jgi:phosphocarrier protein
MNAENDPGTLRETASVWLAHAGGLHARPAIKLTKLARRFAGDIMVGVAAAGPWKDAKSIAQVLSMKVPVETTLHFAAQGEGARQSLDAIVKLVESDFEVADAAEPRDG